MILILTLTYVSHNLSELKRRHHQQKKDHKMNEKPEHVIEDDQQYLNDYRSDERSNEESDFRQAQARALLVPAAVSPQLQTASDILPFFYELDCSS